MAQHPHAGGLGTLLWYYQYTDSRVTISPTVEFTYNAHEDIMGSASYYTKQTGAVYEEHIYDAWGGVRWSTGYGVNDGKTLVIEPNYTGHSYDPILKIYHAEARFYDGKTRQWMASDPIKDGLNWYAYCESNPTTYFDYNGLFIVVPDGKGGYTGTEMTEGARGSDVSELQEALANSNISDKYKPTYTYGSEYAGQIVTSHSSGMFDSQTERAVKEFVKQYNALNGNALRTDGVVDADVWRALGLQSKANTTLEQEFGSVASNSSAGINISIAGNNITINYFTKFYVVERQYHSYMMPNGSIGIYYKDDKVNSHLFGLYTAAFEDAVNLWNRDTTNKVTIQGIEATVAVKLPSSYVNSGANSNVKIILDTYKSAIVKSAFTWIPEVNKTITIHDVPDTNTSHAPGWDFMGTAQHEFGHVLGIWDAYDYGTHNVVGGIFWQGTTPNQHSDGRLNDDSVMLHNWYLTNTFQSYDADYEMMLYAFENGKMQSYYDLGTRLFTELSQAFYR